MCRPSLGFVRTSLIFLFYCESHSTILFVNASSTVADFVPPTTSRYHPSGLLLLDASIQKPVEKNNHPSNKEVVVVDDDNDDQIRDSNNNASSQRRNKEKEQYECSNDISFVGEQNNENRGIDSTTGEHFEKDGMKLDVVKGSGPNVFYTINNNLFEGKLCFLLRDHPDYESVKKIGEFDVYFEVQIQGKFKRKPRGPIYLSVELPQNEVFSLPWPLKAVIKAILSFAKSWGYKWIHTSFGEKGEVPHMATPAFQAFDRVVITKLNDKDPPPTLGESFSESKEQYNLRKKNGFVHEIDTSCTYSFSLKSFYQNPVDWKIYGIPLIKSVDISSMTNVLRLSMYEVKAQEEVEVEPTMKQKKKKKHEVVWGRSNSQAYLIGRHLRREYVMWIQLRRQ